MTNEAVGTWKVSKERIEIFPHPNAEKLELGKVGVYQVVVEKGRYKIGDVVVFVPEKSILTGRIRQEFERYLVGPEKNRVKAVRLRGELSCGVILSPALLQESAGLDLDRIPYSEDLSAALGITKYEPPIPPQLAGEVKPIGEAPFVGKHDCEQFGVYASNFSEGERVIVSEKIHGSQAIYYWNAADNQRFVTSKGQLDKGLCIVESETNSYWRAARRCGLWEILERTGLKQLQVFGEVVPCQGGYNYGQKDARLLIFDVRVAGVSIPYDQVAEDFKKLWVPILYDGPFADVPRLKALATGLETVSGQGLHAREGVVVRPYVDRRAADGTMLRVKIINPAYKETGEEFS